MRRLIAALAVISLALGFTVVLAGPASASLQSPANGATLRGNATLTESGGVDNSTFDRCSIFGDDPTTRIQLLRGSTVLVNEFWTGEGTRSITIDTHDFTNGAYTVRGTVTNRVNSGFGGLGCGTQTITDNHNVTIDNISSTNYTGPTSAPRNTSVSVSATLTDPNKNPQGISGQAVTFSLTGGGSVSGTTNSSGVATASLPITGNARNTTVVASFAGNTFFKPSSETTAFTVGKNSSSTTVVNPTPVVFGQSTSFVAQVARTNGNAGEQPTGTVQFTLDGANFGPPVTLAGGAASSQSTSSLSTGNHTIGATYSGDSNTLGSTAADKTQAVNKAQTATSLVSSGSPTVTGEPVTFTAEVDVVAPGAGNPGGAVQFNVDGQPVGTAVPLSGDTAALTTSALNPGNHEVVATYNGNGDFASSTSGSVTHGVNRADTDVALTTSNPDAVSGEPLTFTATVTPVGPGAGDPTGTVQFAADGAPVGSPVPVTAGTATSPTANLGAGTYEITADYSGDGHFAGSNTSLEQVVEAGQTTTTVTSSPNPSVVGQPVILRAEVDPVAPATGTPVGAVRFTVDGATVDIVDLVDGAAELSISTLTRGDHTVKANFLSENADFFASESAEITQQVNKAATNTVVQSSASPSVFGQPVTFTATVSVQAPGAGVPSGTITFTDGGTVLGVRTVDSSTGFQASITTDDLSVSQHAIVATYSGDDSFLESNGSVIQKVNRAQTSTVVLSSSNPAQTGQPVTFSAEISPVAPGAGDPTGTVRFTVNGANLGGPATVVDGVATSTSFASLSPGTYAIKATYSGDGNFVGSDGLLDAGVGQNIAKGQTSMTLESDDPSAEPGQAVTFTSTVKAVAPATGRPSGVVQVWKGSVLLGATSLSPAGPNTSTATFVTSTLPPGTHAIRAVYVGNFNFDGQTASTSQTVAAAGTVTGVTSSNNPSTFGDDVTLTATVTPTDPAPGSPTGTVTFTDGSTVLGTAPVTSLGGQRQASITLDSLSGGSHAITATYSGDTTYAGSTSAAYTQVVQRAVSTLELNHVIERIGDNGGTVRATLTGNDGVGLAGQIVSFSTSQNIGTAVNPICSGVTDADGYVECHNTNLMPGVIVNGGFDGDFAGNGDYLPAGDHATYTG